jgi:hypothetical protein
VRTFRCGQVRIFPCPDLLFGLRLSATRGGAAKVGEVNEFLGCEHATERTASHAVLSKAGAAALYNIEREVMTDDERELVLHLAGTVKVMLRRMCLDQTLRDFDELVEPVRVRVFSQHYRWDGKEWVRRANSFADVRPDDRLGAGGYVPKCPHPVCDMVPGQHAHYAGGGIGGNSSGGGAGGNATAGGSGSYPYANGGSNCPGERGWYCGTCKQHFPNADHCPNCSPNSTSEQP